MILLFEYHRIERWLFVTAKINTPLYMYGGSDQDASADLCLRLMDVPNFFSFIKVGKGYEGKHIFLIKKKYLQWLFSYY